MASVTVQAPIAVQTWSPVLDDLASGVSGFVARVADRAALAGLNTQANKAAFLFDAGGRNGLFAWDDADLSADVAKDPQQGVYVPPTTDTTGASGAWVRQSRDINPGMFGAPLAIGSDCSTAVQALVDFIVASWDATLNRYMYEGSFAGRIWECSASIDVTQIRNPGIVFKSGGIYSKATGGVAWDMSGSNSVTLLDFHVWGDKTNSPGVGILLAKGDNGAGGFPDAKQHKLIRVSTNGYFSKAAFVSFASEVSETIGCSFQNKSRSTTAAAGIICGHAATLDSYVGGVASTHTTIPTAAAGTQSNILHNWNQCQFLRVSDVVLTITAISKASPAVVTVNSADLTASGLANDDRIYLYNIAGMTELNGSVYTVKNINLGAGTFQLYDEAGTLPVDSTTFGTFTSGHVWNQTGPALIMSSVGGLAIDNGYWLAYGSPNIVFDAKNGGSPRQVRICGQMEHAPATLIRFDLPDTNTAVIQGLDIDLLNANQTVKTALFDTSGGGGGGALRIDGFSLKIASLSAAPSQGLFRNDNKFNIRQANFRVPLAAAWDTALNFASFSGEVHLIDTNEVRIYGGLKIEPGTQFQAPAGVNQAGLILYVNADGALSSKTVALGAPDSGGTGFRMLRVTN